LPELSKTRVFTVCDVRNVQLDDPSSYLTTFAMSLGRYRWSSMPMGISPAPEDFQRLLNQALEGLQGIHIIADDVLITGEMAYKDHDRKLRLFLDRCRDQVERRQIQTTDKRNVPNEIVHYYSFQDELTVHDGVVIKGERVVIPDALRSDVRLVPMCLCQCVWAPPLEDKRPP